MHDNVSSSIEKQADSYVTSVLCEELLFLLHFHFAVLVAQGKALPHPLLLLK